MDKFAYSVRLKGKLLILSAAILILSCEGKKNGHTTSIDSDSLLIKYQVLQDSVDRNWKTMIADDDDKHSLMRRLLLEVSYTNNYDKASYQELMGQLEALKAMRYDQGSMRNSALIDAYDSATFEFSDRLFVFARSHPRFPDFPLMGELINDINEKNNFILIHRIHYDGWVKQFNAFQVAHKKKLLEVDPEVEIETMPLFELPS